MAPPEPKNGKIPAALLMFGGIIFTFAFSAIAFMMQNGPGNQSLRSCACTVDELERVLKRDLFCTLDNSMEKVVEATIVWDDWGIKQK